MARGLDIEERLMAFAVRVGRIVDRLPSNRLGTHVARQLVRCGTAPAANYAEAQGAESRRDFIHKLQVAVKELRETLVWLRFSVRMQLARGTDAQKAGSECNELIAILVKSIKTAKRNQRRKR